MIRLVLCAILCGATVVLALATAAIQSGNRDRGIALDATKQECDMLEAVNGDRCQRILAQDCRPLAREPELVQHKSPESAPRSPASAPKSSESAPKKSDSAPKKTDGPKDRKDERAAPAPPKPLLAAGERRSQP